MTKAVGWCLFGGQEELLLFVVVVAMVVAVVVILSEIRVPVSPKSTKSMSVQKTTFWKLKNTKLWLCIGQGQHANGHSVFLRVSHLRVTAITTKDSWLQ